MPQFHPNDNTLSEYASGSVDRAVSIIVSAHIEMCSECARKVKDFEAIGGELLSIADAEPVTDGQLEKVMSLITVEEANGVTSSEEPEVVQTRLSQKTRKLPRVLDPLFENDALRWRKVSRALTAAHSPLGQDKYEANFHKITKGGKVARHDHSGNEYTLVLQGSFSDQNGTYMAGDFIEREPGEVHQPIAAANEDCLCFSIAEAPVKLTGIIGRVINPFIGHKPA